MGRGLIDIAESQDFGGLIRFQKSILIDVLNITSDVEMVFGIFGNNWREDERDREFLVESSHGGDWLKVVSSMKDKAIFAKPLELDLGSAVFGSDYLNLNALYETTMWHKFLRPIGIAESFTIAFANPLSSRSVFRLSIEIYDGHDLSKGPEKHEVELAFIPFYIAWGVKLRFLDADRAVSWLTLLSKVTPRMVLLLRELTCAPRYSLKNFSNRFEVSPKTVTKQFELAYGLIEPLLHDEYDAGQGNSARLVDLANAFHFLRSVGRPMTKDEQVKKVNLVPEDVKFWF